jgi:hypothetical protein
MSDAPAAHKDRIRNAVNTFEAATDRIVKVLEGLSDDAARRAPGDGGWTPAQVGAHVAIANETFAGILSGAIPMAQPAPSGFVEDAGVFAAIPPRAKTMPPLDTATQQVSRTDAINRLRAARTATIGAMQGLDAGRAAGNTVTLPFGTISLYQAAELLGPHTDRHIAQIHRCAAS